MMSRNLQKNTVPTLKSYIAFLLKKTENVCLVLGILLLGFCCVVAMIFQVVYIFFWLFFFLGVGVARWLLAGCYAVA